MNVGFLTWEFPPKIVGGLGTYSWEITRQFVKMGHNVYVFSLNDGKLKTREIMEGIEVHRPRLVDVSSIFPNIVKDELRHWGAGLKFFSDIYIYNILSAGKIINKLIPQEDYRFDVIAIHDWLSSTAGLILRSNTKLPIVFHIHSTERGRTQGMGSSLVSDLEKSMAEAADRIITVSEAMKEELGMYTFPTQKVEVVYNGVDPEKYNPENVPQEKIMKLREKYGVNEETNLILFLGRLTPIKGADRLIQAMPIVLRDFPNTKLVLVGKGEMKDYINHLIESLRLKEKVIFVDEFLPEKDRILHYAASDLCVFPSLYEPFGIVALEAMSMKKPVVVGARGISGLKEIVIPSGPSQTGIHVNPYDPTDIAWGINALLEDKKKMRIMGDNGRERVLEHFTWDRAAKRTLEVYSQVINSYH
ncbi:MAG: glycosyltransferase family 4 protein [Nitrososphaerales archaeon]